MRRTTKLLFASGTILLIYGYLCRELHIYFFWDSKVFGWIILLIALLFYLINLNKIRTRHGRKTFWVKIGIIMTFLALPLAGYLIYDFNNSEPYRVAKEYLKTNSELRDEVGNIRAFGVIPAGTIETTSINGVESGHASLTVTVMGDKKYKDVYVNLKETSPTGWVVASVY
jgi:cytochrome oxidase complex assembly protein 1